MAFAFLVVLAAVVPVGRAQQLPSSISPVYDDFNHRWIDPAKWQVGAGCWASHLECVREIEDGKLRLALRSFGSRDWDSGLQFNSSVLPFPQGIANSITSIRANVQVRAPGGSSCPSNADPTNSEAEIGGNFFNMGDGSSNQDVFAWLKAYTLPNSQTVDIILSWGAIEGGDVGVWIPFATYPAGTPLVMTLGWDQANRTGRPPQFRGRASKSLTTRRTAQGR